MNQTQKSIAALILTMVTWSSAFVAIRYLMVAHYSAGELALSRYLVASIAMLYPFMTLKHKQKPSLKDLFAFFLFGAFGVSLYNLALNYGERTVSAGIANFIIAQAPVLMAIVAALLFKERITRWGVFGFVISIIGAIFILFGEAESKAVDVGVLFLYIAVLSSVTYSMGQKFFLKKYHPIEITTYAIWACTISLLFYLPDTVSRILASNGRQIVAVVYLGVFPSAIGYWLWCYAFKHVQAVKAASFFYLMPVITLLFAWLFLAEIPNVLAIIGGLIALGGAIVVSRYGLVSARR